MTGFGYAIDELARARGGWADDVVVYGLEVVGDADAPVAIFNEKEDNAAMWVRAIRQTVENSIIFQVLFPELLPDFRAVRFARRSPDVISHLRVGVLVWVLWNSCR